MATTSYRIYLNHSIQGPYNIEELVKLENLSKETLVCEVGDIEWQFLGDCRPIQKHLSFQSFKGGPDQQGLLNVSSAPTVNPGSVRAVSTSGDFVQGQNRPVRTAKVAFSKSFPAKKDGMFSWISTILHGGSQK
jgi:hypothetical protein